MQEGQDVYLEVFHTELEAFKHRVREYAVSSISDAHNNVEQQKTSTNYRLDPKEALDSLPPVSAPSLPLTGCCSYTTQLLDGTVELLYVHPVIIM